MPAPHLNGPQIRIRRTARSADRRALGAHSAGHFASPYAIVIPPAPRWIAAGLVHGYPADHSLSRRSALPCEIRPLSAGLTGSLSRKARACAIDAYGWSAENMIRSTPT